jgi:hypothetical protein
MDACPAGKVSIKTHDAAAQRTPMNPPPKKMRQLATRLILFEANASESVMTENQKAAIVIQKLRPQLVDLVGNTGFHALVMRSLSLAKDQVTELDGARVNPDGSLEGLGAPPDPNNPQRDSTGGTLLVAGILGLLASFIGELLTLQLVTEVWPKLPIDGYFNQGTDHEKKN